MYLEIPSLNSRKNALAILSTFVQIPFKTSAAISSGIFNLFYFFFIRETLPRGLQFNLFFKSFGNFFGNSVGIIFYSFFDTLLESSSEIPTEIYKAILLALPLGMHSLIAPANCLGIFQVISL